MIVGLRRALLRERSICALATDRRQSSRPPLPGEPRRRRGLTTPPALHVLLDALVDVGSPCIYLPLCNGTKSRLARRRHCSRKPGTPAQVFTDKANGN